MAEDRSSATCSRCGHPASEHRAEVLPFAVCRHIDSREYPYGGARWSFAGTATPCFCTEFQAAA